MRRSLLFVRRCAACGRAARRRLVVRIASDGMRRIVVDIRLAAEARVRHTAEQQSADVTTGMASPV